MWPRGSQDALSGIWDTNAGKLASVDRHIAFRNNSQILALVR